MKKCAKCKIDKEDCLFYKLRTRGGKYLSSYCKDCLSIYHKERFRADPKGHSLRSAVSRKRWKLKAKYNLDLETFEQMIEEQQGRCSICNTETKLHVDHCHTTGKVRGLLCYFCNNGLGCFKDNTQRLENALGYLRSG